MSKKTKNRYTDKELESFRKIINEKILEEIEKEDCIFPLISPFDWKKKI